MFNKNMKKFIINRNSQEFYYGERTIENKEYVYTIYHNSKPLAYDADCFYDIFGTDKKLSIYSFLNKASVDILTREASAEQKDKMSKEIEFLLSKISGKQYANPNIHNIKNRLLKFIKEYNELPKKEDKEDSIDFIEEYQQIKKLNQDRKQIKTPEPVYYENYGARTKQDIA